MSAQTVTAADLQPDLADRLRKALRISGVSVQDMAAELGVGRNAVSSYINGHTRPGRAAVRVWALSTGVPLSWLETGETPRHVGGGSTFVAIERVQDWRACRDSNPKPSDP